MNTIERDDASDLDRATRTIDRLTKQSERISADLAASDKSREFWREKYAEQCALYHDAVKERNEARAERDAAARKVAALLLRVEADHAALESMVEKRAPVWESASAIINASRRNETGDEGAEGSGVLIAWESLHESITGLIDERDATRADFDRARSELKIAAERLCFDHCQDGAIDSTLKRIHTDACAKRAAILAGNLPEASS